MPVPLVQESSEIEVLFLAFLIFLLCVSACSPFSRNDLKYYKTSVKLNIWGIDFSRGETSHHHITPPTETVPFHKPHWVHYTEWTPSLIRQSIKCAIKKADAIHWFIKCRKIVSRLLRNGSEFSNMKTFFAWMSSETHMVLSGGNCPNLWWAIFGKRRLNFEVSRFNKCIGKVAPRFRCNSSRDAHTFHFSVACLGFINARKCLGEEATHFQDKQRD